MSVCGACSTGTSSSRRSSARAASTARKLTRVDDEADAGADGGDQDAGHGRADDPRRVEETGVECDGVRELTAPDELERERLPPGRVEHEDHAAERRQGVDERQRDRSGERHDGEEHGDRHRGRLCRQHDAARVEPVDDESRYQPRAA